MLNIHYLLSFDSISYFVSLIVALKRCIGLIMKTKNLVYRMLRLFINHMKKIKHLVIYTNYIAFFFMEIVQNELYAKWGRFLSHGDIGRSLGDRYLGFVLLEPTCLFYLLTWKGNLLPPPNNLLPVLWEF